MKQNVLTRDYPTFNRILIVSANIFVYLMILSVMFYRFLYADGGYIAYFADDFVCMVPQRL